MCRPILPSPSRTVNLESGTVSVPVNNPARQLAQAMIFLAPQDLIILLWCHLLMPQTKEGLGSC